jgi:hypothetical protein
MAAQLPIRARASVGVRSLLGLLPVVIVLIGCRERQQAALRVQRGRETLQSQLRAAEQNDNGSPFRRFLVERIRDALTRMDELPGDRLPSPIPVLAFVNVGTAREDDRCSLGINWVEEGFVVNGFYLSDENGKVTDYPATLPWEPDDREFLARSETAWRENWVPVITDASDKSWQNHRVGGRPVRPPVLLPRLDYATVHVRLGLLTRDGRVPSTVAVGFRRVSEVRDKAGAFDTDLSGSVEKTPERSSQGAARGRE